MKRIFVMMMALLAIAGVEAASRLSAYKGVWSSDSAEAVITDSICIFYYQSDSTLQAVLEIPSADIVSKTVFAKGGVVTTTAGNPSLTISRSGNAIDVDGFRLKKVEDIHIVKPYEMAQCKSKYDVGKCLQQWRLGAGYGVNGDMIYCEVNTNRNMFVYMVSPSMTYIRAAAARNNDNGTLFFQNIRMMKNQNTGEYTMSIEPDNYRLTRDDLTIDDTKFQPNSCTFSPDGGIYWSLISFEPDRILINGCGETYKVERPELNPGSEWFEYVPYSVEAEFPKLR